MGLWLSVVQAQQIQPPDAFLGYELGTQFTFHHQVVNYFEYVSRVASDRVRLIPYGHTYEGRPLMVAAVSSEENIRNLDQLRQNNLIRARLAEGEASGRQVPFVWFGYNIHGNESVSTEVAMAMIYALVTQDTAQWLNDLVLIIDPCINPDGRDRYTNWYRQVANQRPFLQGDGYEHHEPWPGGRYNHYLFDLNRDWCWQTQVENQQRATLYYTFMPHVLVDFHEMGANSTYFFGPSAKPYHEVITPWQREFHERVGENNSRYFDERSWLYFTREVYDLLYPSYGDTWSTYNGAVGFTYEQGGSGRAGRALIIANGDTLTLHDRMAHHFIAGWGTIETAHRQRERLIGEFNRFFETAENNPDSRYKSYVIKTGDNPGAVDAFLQLMNKQKVRYGHPAQAGKNYRGYSYRSGNIKGVSIEAEDILISAYQPQSRMVQVLMEPDTYLEDSVTYDLTAWALPYAYGLDAYALEERLEVSPMDGPLLGEINNLKPARSPYAWIAPWEDLRGLKLLAGLLREGIRVRSAERPFSLGGNTYARGSLIILKTDNPQPEFDSKVLSVANACQVPLEPLQTGFVNTGKDFGSADVNFIEKPRIALINGDGVSPSGFGELWHFFESDLDFPVAIIHTDYLNRIALAKYDVIILPSGNYGAFRDKLIYFVRNGGKLVVLESAIRTFTSGSEEDPPALALGQMMLKKKDKGDDPEPEEAEFDEEESFYDYEDHERMSLSNYVAGSVFEVEVDETHPLAFGVRNPLFLIKRSSTPYPYLPEGEWNVGIFKGDAHRSGFTGAKLRKRLKNTLSFGVEELGDGKVIYFSDSPIIRQFWYSGKLLMGNAVFIVGNE